MRLRQKGLIDAILCADFHLSESRPVCRLDDYIAAQEAKLKFIRWQQRNRGGGTLPPVLCAGDVFDRWRISPGFAAWAYRMLPRNLVAVPGNHDLPMRSLQEYHRSALSLMETVLEGNLTVLRESPCEVNVEGRKILLLHELVVPSKDASLSAVAGARPAQEVLAQYKGHYDVIVTGDNHQAFVEYQGSTLLVNPGSMLRISADQIDHRPRIYLYFASDNSVSEAFYPIQEGVVSRDHIEQREAHDRRIAAYVERLQKQWDLSVSFVRNLEAFFVSNRVPQRVRDIIYRALEEEE